YYPHTLYYTDQHSTPQTYPHSLHDALPISLSPLSKTITNRSGSLNGNGRRRMALTTLKIAVFAPMLRASVSTATAVKPGFLVSRSEEHTSELQSRFDVVCRLMLERKNQVDD